MSSMGDPVNATYAHCGRGRSWLKSGSLSTGKGTKSQVIYSGGGADRRGPEYAVRDDYLASIGQPSKSVANAAVQAQRWDAVDRTH